MLAVQEQTSSDNIETTDKTKREMISIEDLSLIFPSSDGDIHALSNINLSIKSGDFVSFIGPSGCGKTTLLRVIADLEQPTTGKLKVNGTDAQDARLNRLYGYVFQAPALFPWRNIRDNCALPLEISKQSNEHQNNQVDKWVAIDDLNMSPQFNGGYGLENFVLTPRSTEGIKQSGIKEQILGYLK